MNLSCLSLGPAGCRYNYGDLVNSITVFEVGFHEYSSAIKVRFLIGLLSRCHSLTKKLIVGSRKSFCLKFMTLLVVSKIGFERLVKLSNYLILITNQSN